MSSLDLEISDLRNRNRTCTIISKFSFPKAAKWVAFSFLALFISWSLPAISKTESLRKDVEQAILEKNLSKALRLVEEKILTLEKSKRKELVEWHSLLSQMFMTEKGQKAFERGESLLLSLQGEQVWTQSLESFKEAFVEEPQNSKVIQSLIRANLVNKNCSEAHSLLLEFEKTFYQNLFDLKLRILQCLERWTDIGLLLNPVRSSGINSGWALPFVEWAMQTKDDLSLEFIFKELKSLEGDNPRVWAMECKYLKAKGLRTASCSEKYIQICENFDSSLNQKYVNDIPLCVKKEIDEMKKNINLK